MWTFNFDFYILKLNCTVSEIFVILQMSTVLKKLIFNLVFFNLFEKLIRNTLYINTTFLLLIIILITNKKIISLNLLFFSWTINNTNWTNCSMYLYHNYIPIQFKFWSISTVQYTSTVTLFCNFWNLIYCLNIL